MPAPQSDHSGPGTFAFIANAAAVLITFLAVTNQPSTVRSHRPLPTELERDIDIEYKSDGEFGVEARRWEDPFAAIDRLWRNRDANATPTPAPPPTVYVQTASPEQADYQKHESPFQAKGMGLASPSATEGSSSQADSAAPYTSPTPNRGALEDDQSGRMVTSTPTPTPVDLRQSLAEKPPKEVDQRLSLPELSLPETRKGQRRLVIAVYMTGGSSPERVESRLRYRYSIEMALATNGWLSDQNGRLNCRRDPITFDDPSLEPRRPIFREWGYDHFVHPEKSVNLGIYVLWLDSRYFGLTNLPINWNSISSSDAVAVFHMGGSDALKSTADRLIAEKDGGESILKGIKKVYFPVATATGIEATKSFSQKVERTTTDEELVASLCGELHTRLPDLNRSNVILVTEADSIFSRKLAELTAKQLAPGKRSDLEPKILEFPFLRGLDGISSDSVPPTRPDSKTAGGSPAQSVAEMLARRGELESPQGRSQYDYLERMHKALAQGEAGGAARAVGIFCTDPYDKLMILDALRPHYPQAVFFTTELDANFLTTQSQPTAHNLIVAARQDLDVTKVDKGHRYILPSLRSTNQKEIFLKFNEALDLLGTDSPESKNPVSDSNIYEIANGTYLKLKRSDPAPACITAFTSWLASGGGRWVLTIVIFLTYLAAAAIWQIYPGSGRKSLYAPGGIILSLSFLTMLCLAALDARSYGEIPTGAAALFFLALGTIIFGQLILLAVEAAKRGPNRTQKSLEIRPWLWVLAATSSFVIAILLFYLTHGGLSSMREGFRLAMGGTSVALSVLIRCLAAAAAFWAICDILRRFSISRRILAAAFRSELDGTPVATPEFGPLRNLIDRFFTRIRIKKTQRNQTPVTTQPPADGIEVETHVPNADDVPNASSIGRQSFRQCIAITAGGMLASLKRVFGTTRPAYSAAADNSSKKSLLFAEIVGKYTRSGNALADTLVIAALYMLAITILDGILFGGPDPRLAPTRGPYAFLMEKLSVIISEFWLVPLIALCTVLHRRCSVLLVGPFLDQFRGQKPGRFDSDTLVALRALGSHIEMMSSIIIYPFSLIGLLVVSRLAIFDDWSWSPHLALSFLLGIVAVYWLTIALNMRALRLRAAVLDDLDDEICREEEDKRDRYDYLCDLRGEVNMLESGPFAPWYRQTVFAIWPIFLGAFGLIASIQPIVGFVRAL